MDKYFFVEWSSVETEYINKVGTMGGASFFLPNAINNTSLQSDPQHVLTAASHTNCSYAVDSLLNNVFLDFFPRWIHETNP